MWDREGSVMHQNQSAICPFYSACRHLLIQVNYILAGIQVNNDSHKYPPAHHRKFVDLLSVRGTHRINVSP